MNHIDKINILIQTSDALIKKIKESNQDDDTSRVIFALWNEAILLLKEVLLHAKNKTFIGLKLLGRELYEIFLYLRYMVEDDTDFRALCYTYVSLLKGIRTTSFFVSGTDENNAIRNSRVNLANELISGFPDAPQHLTNQIAIIDDSKFNLVRTIIGQIKKKAKKIDWYHIASKKYGGEVISDIRELARRLNLEYTYLSFYMPYSEQMHGMNLFKNLDSIKNNKTTVVSDCKVVIELSRDVILKVLKYFGNKLNILQELIGICTETQYFDLLDNKFRTKIEILKNANATKR